jgi:hypothetical protein
MRLGDSSMDKGRERKRNVVLSSFPVKNFTISFMHFLSRSPLFFRDTKWVLNYVSLANGNDGREILFPFSESFAFCGLREAVIRERLLIAIGGINGAAGRRQPMYGFTWVILKND